MVLLSLEFSKSFIETSALVMQMIGAFLLTSCSGTFGRLLRRSIHRSVMLLGIFQAEAQRRRAEWIVEVAS
jgi:hypothetical protein